MKQIFSLLGLYAVSAQECTDPGNDINSDRIDLSSDTVMYSCRQGFISVLGEPTITISCQGGQWSPFSGPSESPLCIEDSETTTEGYTSEEETSPQDQPCQDPGLIDNGKRWFDHFNHGGLVYFSCNADYCAKDMRTRTIEMQCVNGKWSAQAPTCVPCNQCIPPSEEILEKKKIGMTLNIDFTADLICDDGYVITPGTSITDGTVECIEGGLWAPEIPTCSRKPQVICGSDEISLIINKNMLDNLGFTGGENSLAMTGLNADTEIIMKGCKPTVDDLGVNYSFHIQSPYAGKCMTHFEHVKSDGLGNEANKYNFRNKIVWRQNSGAVMRSSTILDFTCEYDGLFTTGLDGPIKLALSTRTYIDKRKGYNQQEFTVSMGIYANKNFTNLLETSQVVHRGKRYFVALWLHENEKGTPFLDRCYGSPNEISQDELIKMGRMPEAEHDIRELVVDGCPAAVTLTRLEVPGSTADRRFSFMYPYVAVDGYSSNYMYIHCEIKLRPTGFKPNCVRPNSAAVGSGIGGLTSEDGEKLGKGQFMQRSYSGNTVNGQYIGDPNKVRGNLAKFFEDALGREAATSIAGDKFMHDPNKARNQYEQHRKFQEEGDLAKANGIDMSNLIMGKSSNGGNFNSGNNGQWEGFAGRKRRSVSDQLGKPDGYSVSIGPMVMITDDDINPEDIKEVVMKTKIPLKANPDGTVVFDEEADPNKEIYDFKFNTTYKSREDDVQKFKKLLPADRYVEKFDSFPGKIEWESEKLTQEEKDQNKLEDAMEEIVAESIEEEIEQEENEESENFAIKAIGIIAGFIIGGAILFALALYITINLGNNSENVQTKKKIGKANSKVPTSVVTGPDMKKMQDDEKELNKSCGSSLTSAE